MTIEYAGSQPVGSDVAKCDLDWFKKDRHCDLDWFIRIQHSFRCPDNT